MTQNTPVWLNEPPRHGALPGGGISVRTGPETDFWNSTFYGFRHDNGHMLAHTITGDFSLELTFSADYATLYDQAGAMLRVDADNWLKCGVEYTDGAMHFSVVVTRDDQSDWSVLRLNTDPATPLTLRLTRHAEALRVQLLVPSGQWQLVRLAYLRMPETVAVGPMCCAPVGTGLDVTFQRIAFGPPIPRDLHAD